MHQLTRLAFSVAFALSVSAAPALIQPALIQPALIQPAFAQDATPRTVATVNGKAITEVEMAMLMQQLPPEALQGGIAPIYPRMVEQLIGQRLMADRAISDGFDRRPEIALRLEALKTAMLYTLYIQEAAAADITDAMVQEEYGRVASSMGGDEINVSHILVDTQEEALEIVGLINNGTPFEDLARERSKDPGSGANGGDLGWARKGMFVGPFEEAAFGLRANTFTDVPVQSRFGWHVIWVKEVRPLSPPTFEQVEGQLREQLVQGRIAALIDAAIADAQIQRFDMNGDPMPAPAAQ